MGLFNKILTAIRGSANEFGQNVVDANATRIFEQEIRDAEKHLSQAKQELTEVMAKEIQAARDTDRIKSTITEHENYAAQALQQGNESLALEVAEKILQLEQELVEQQKINDSFTAHVTKLRELVNKTEHQLAEYNRELHLVKTTQSVQKATESITDSFSSSHSKLANAKDSLERIKARQQQFDDRLKAAETLNADTSGLSLKSKLAAAGIGEQTNSASSVLERIKAQKQQE